MRLAAPLLGLLVALHFALAACTARQPTDDPPESIPRVDVALSSLMSIGDVSTGILLGDRLVLTAAHSGVLDADVMVVDEHATYVEQIVGLPLGLVGRCLNEVSPDALPAELDWALVRLADDLADRVDSADGRLFLANRSARVMLNADPPPGTEVTLVGWIRGRRLCAGDPTAWPQRRALAGTIIARPRGAEEGDDVLFVRTGHRRIKGFSGGPVFMQDDDGEWTVIGMSVIEWQPFLRSDYTTVIALKLTPEMIVPSIDGRSLAVLGRRGGSGDRGANSE